MSPLNVVKIDPGWETVLILPDQIGQTQQNDDDRGNPKPFAAQPAALGSSEKTSGKADKKERGRVFVFQSQSEKHAAPHQQLRLIAVDRAQQEVDAAHPEQGLE